MPEQPICGVCGSARVRLLYPPEPATTFEPMAGSSRTHIRRPTLFACCTCRAWFQAPLPQIDEVLSLYRETDDETYVAEAPSRKANADRQAQLTRRVAGGRGRLLDVGCSAGYFLDAARSQGFEVEGLEVSHPLARRAEKKGHQVTCASVEEASFRLDHFDVITLWDVLEHVRDPVGCLNKLREWLAPEGSLVLNVPASDSLVARFLGRRWPLLLPEHLHYFSRQSLSTLLKNTGYGAPGFSLHPVTFSASYVAHRLRQHEIPGARFADSCFRRTALGKIPIPLLMGEVTAVARKL